MLETHDLQETIGREVYGSDGEKIGKVGQLFMDDQTGRPEFVTVNTGFFGTNESFVPVADATVSDDRLTVPYTKEVVKNAPNVDAENGHISEHEEQRIYEHYGLSYSPAASDTARTDTALTDEAGVRPAGHDTSGPETDSAMTRSEEQLHVGTEQRETGRVRLRKYVETENVTTTVPVRKERAVLEREPITDANAGAAMSGGEITEEEHEVVLREEKPVVQKTTEPVERVRVGKVEETDEHQVSEDVRKEQFDVEGDVDRKDGI